MRYNLCLHATEILSCVLKTSLFVTNFIYVLQKPVHEPQISAYLHIIKLRVCKQINDPIYPN